jgi:FkbM family methyltransferase
MPLFSGAYSLARQRRLLERRWFRRVYSVAYAAYKRLAEDPFAALLRRAPELMRGGSVVDVGANIGYTARIFCAALEPGFRVYAFEPDPDSAGLLEENLSREIGRGRLLPVRSAVGSRSGTVTLLRSPSHPGDHRIDTLGRAMPGAREPLLVPLVSLDEFFEARPPEPLAFVKLDVQGYEIEVCRGMRRILERPAAPALAIEHAPDDAAALGFEADAAPSFLRGLGYSLRLLRRDGALAPWPSPQALALLETRGYVDLLCVK